MFLEKTVEKNKELINVAFELHKKGVIEPDTYVIDLDRTIENARRIKEEADKYNVVYLKLSFLIMKLEFEQDVQHDLSLFHYLS